MDVRTLTCNEKGDVTSTYHAERAHYARPLAWRALDAGAALPSRVR